MKLSEIIEGLEVIESTAAPDAEISDLCYDSRRAGTGSLFVAITGFESDGHKFIGSAAEKGACAVICEKKPDCGIPYVLVRDSRLALAVCSRNFFGRADEKMTMLAVTGTNGKTTSTFLIKHVLEQCLGAKVGLIGTTCNMIGEREMPSERTTPESYELHGLLREMYDAGCTHVVMEVSSHSLILHRVAGLRFKFGIFTNLTQDHLDFHGNMEEYARAKSLLFSQTELAVINYDDAWAGFMREHAQCPAVTFSEKSNDAD